MLNAVEFSHQLLGEHLAPGDMAIDATAGNGHDTFFLTQLTGPEGMVFGFDVQAGAISATRMLLESRRVPAKSWQLFQAGHETMAEAIPLRWHGCAGAVIFNLGYLPGGDKSIKTAASSTIPAMRAALRILRPGGILIAVLYNGHPGGMEESSAAREFAAGLSPGDYHAIEYRTVNARNHPPAVLAIRKNAGGPDVSRTEA